MATARASKFFEETLVGRGRVHYSQVSWKTWGDVSYVMHMICLDCGIQFVNAQEVIQVLTANFGKLFRLDLGSICNNTPSYQAKFLAGCW